MPILNAKIEHRLVAILILNALNLTPFATHADENIPNSHLASIDPLATILDPEWMLSGCLNPMPVHHNGQDLPCPNENFLNTLAQHWPRWIILIPGQQHIPHAELLDRFAPIGRQQMCASRKAGAQHCLDGMSGASDEVNRASDIVSLLELLHGGVTMLRCRYYPGPKDVIQHPRACTEQQGVENS
jgi:hypothetical protein